MVRQLWWVVVLALAACATNPYKTSDDRSARLIGKRAIVYPDTRMKEFVYFMQLNQLDLRDRWGDYPHDMVVPGGKNKLLVVCEWYSEFAREPVARAIRQVKESFIAGHEYRVTSQYVGENTCETKFTDQTLAEANAEAAQKAAEEKPPEKKSAQKDDVKPTTTKTKSTTVTKSTSTATTTKSTSATKSTSTATTTKSTTATRSTTSSSSKKKKKRWRGRTR